MTLRIEQAVQKGTTGRWSWSVWIEAQDNELDRVRSVEYVLDPTYVSPVRTADDRNRKFRIDDSGWSEFEISAHVHGTDGSRLHLRHWLMLRDPADPSAGSSRDRTVFVSSGLEDAQWEDVVRRAFTDRGVDVLTSSDLPAGVSWETALGSSITRSDAMVCILSDTPSAWTEREAAWAMAKNVPVVPLAVDDDAQIPSGLSGVQAVHVHSPKDVDKIVQSIVDRLQ